MNNLPPDNWNRSLDSDINKVAHCKKQNVEQMILEPWCIQRKHFTVVLSSILLRLVDSSSTYSRSRLILINNQLF